MSNSQKRTIDFEVGCTVLQVCVVCGHCGSYVHHISTGYLSFHAADSLSIVERPELVEVVTEPDSVDS